MGGMSAQRGITARRSHTVARLVPVAGLTFLFACGSGPTVRSAPPGPAEPAVPTTTAPVVATTTGAAAATTVVPSTTAAPERLTTASRLRLDGIGPVMVGMTLEQASAAAGTAIRVVVPSARPPECSYAQADEGPAGLSF